MATKTRIVPVQDQYTGEWHRFNIGGADDLDLSARDWGTGIDLEGVYLMPRAQRVIVELYSRWDAGNGRVRGTSFIEADNDMIAKLIKRFDGLKADQESVARLVALLPEYADA